MQQFSFQKKHLKMSSAESAYVSSANELTHGRLRDLDAILKMHFQILFY